VVAGLIGIVEIICIGGLLMVGVMKLAECLTWRERQHQAALKYRRQALVKAQRIREAPVVARSTYEINMLAHQAYQAMLRAAIEADCGASKTPAKKHRC
jgi:hypothetical protein